MMDRSHGHDLRLEKTNPGARRVDPVPVRGIDIAGAVLARQPGATDPHRALNQLAPAYGVFERSGIRFAPWTGAPKQKRAPGPDAIRTDKALALRRIRDAPSSHQHDILGRRRDRVSPHQSLPELLGADETGADPFATAPDQRAYPKHLTARGKGQAKQLGYRQIADVKANPVFRDVDDGAFDPWRFGRRNHKSRRVQIDPDAFARAEFCTLSRHRVALGRQP